MKRLLSKAKMLLWLIIYSPYYRMKYFKCKKERGNFNVMDSNSTINYILEHKCSVSRFGDGELAMIYHLMDSDGADNFYIKSFQSYDKSLAIRLREILTSSHVNHKVAIPYSIVSTEEYIGRERTFWERFVILDMDRFKTLLNGEYTYLNSCFTRFYLHHKRKGIDKYVENLKKIWCNKNIYIVEGANSRLGVGNDLFNGARSIHRILCPSINAYGKYKQILAEVIKCPNDSLFLLALGHTATVLAYDLSQLGYWAIDIGHVDIEYEWYLMGCRDKKAVTGKYVNEIPEGRVLVECSDPIYQNQIVAVVE
jgi:glycosyltransferase family protein